NFFNGFSVDKWPDSNTFLTPLAHLELVDSLKQLLCERLINISVNIKTISADTGLPRCPEFGCDGPTHRRIKVGILKHNKRRVSAQFHGDFFDRRCALLHQRLADFCGAGEGEFSYCR